MHFNVLYFCWKCAHFNTHYFRHKCVEQLCDEVKGKVKHYSSLCKKHPTATGACLILLRWSCISIRSQLMGLNERMRINGVAPMPRVLFNALTLLVGWWEGYSCRRNLLQLPPWVPYRFGVRSSAGIKFQKRTWVKYKLKVTMIVVMCRYWLKTFV